MLLLTLTAAPLAVYAAGAGGALSEIGTADDVLISAAPTQPDGEVAEDGINTNVVTAWIIGVSAVVSAALVALTVVLAKKNRDAK